MPGIVFPSKCPRCIREGAFLGQQEDKTCWYCSQWKMSGTCKHCGLVICGGCVQKMMAPAPKPEAGQQPSAPPYFPPEENI